MGVRILTDGDQAVMYCSTTGWAFGPVIATERGDADREYRVAEERMQAFFRWMDTTETWGGYDKHPAVLVRGTRRDPRELTDPGMERAYGDWLMQETAQYRAEDEAKG